MSKALKIGKGRCKKVVQIFLLSSFLPICFASEQSDSDILGIAIDATENTRNPANFIPDDDLGPVPFEEETWTQKILVPDDSGVLNNMKSTINHWEEREQYVKNWNLESTGLYVLPSNGDKRRSFEKFLLKYLDKRLSGEIKRSEEGSTLRKVGQVQKALSPKAEAAFSKNFKLKFRAKVLQRRAKVIIVNPFVDSHANINSQGKVHVNVSRNIAALGVSTHVDYHLQDEVWSTSFDRQLTSELLGRVSSSQSNKDMAFGGRSDTRVELLFNKSF